MGFELGTRAGVYEFVSVHERARTGPTYKVRNVVAERFELLRILHKDLRENGEELDRFLREIKVHARLSHPNIVTFYSAAELDGQLIITSESFAGITLEKRLEAGAMPVKEAAAYMSQILSALEYAHQQGIVHREVSPANILLGADGAVKLSGFGLAKSATDAQLTSVGTVMGWIEYMSPEQVKGVTTIDGRTDIYSAGAVLYEMVTGQLPFGGKNQFEVMAAHVTAPPPPPIGIKPDLPPDLNRIILTALAKEPDSRFQSAAEFREALSGPAKAATTEKHRAQPGAEPILEIAPQAQGLGYHRLFLTAVFTFILVAVAFFAVLKIARL